MPGRVTLLVLVVLSSVVLAAASGNIYTRSASIYSTSPENIFMTGSHDFYSILSQKGYHTELGSPDYIATRYYLQGKTLYAIIGPDKPFTSEEASLLAKLTREGRIALLVADETGNTNALLERLAGIKIAGSMLESRVTGQPSYVVPLICLGRVIVSTKVSWLESVPPGARIVCWAEPSPGKRYPVAALVRVGKGVALVVSDSSIFSNFEIEGLKPFPSTRSTAVALVELIAQKYPVHYIVFDNSHYITGRIVQVSALLRESISALINLLSGIASWIEARILAVFSLVVATPLALSLLVTGLPEKHGEKRKDLVNVEEVIATIRTIIGKDRGK